MDKKRVLIVDDELDFLEIMTYKIESWGYEVVAASNGREALEALRDKKPDMVILDYRMPDMDGVGVLKQMRKINKKIPVIMFTAQPDAKSMKETGKLGVCSYIPKLSVYSDVQSVLKTALDMLRKKKASDGKRE